MISLRDGGISCHPSTDEVEGKKAGLKTDSYRDALAWADNVKERTATKQKIDRFLNADEGLIGKRAKLATGRKPTKALAAFDNKKKQIILEAVRDLLRDPAEAQGLLTDIQNRVAAWLETGDSSSAIQESSRRSAGMAKGHLMKHRM